mmetsp:Transcript_30371/g.43507  ORF Transcript_30371/g.43507 Transcript_30371/m.43507 type:complete len:450 (-) Transcript_30371:206-1555(-)
MWSGFRVLKGLLILFFLSFNDAELDDVNNLQNEHHHCNPSTKVLFAKFLVKQWILARHELEIELISDEPTLVSSKNITESMQYVLSTVNGFSAGVKVYYVKKNVIPYAVLWKCASDGIIRNLHSAALSDPRSPYRTSLSFDATSQINTNVTVETMHRMGMMLDMPAPINLHTVTFVRDPLQRFIAGFVEATHRTLNPIFASALMYYNPIADVIASIERNHKETYRRSSTSRNLRKSPIIGTINKPKMKTKPPNNSIRNITISSSTINQSSSKPTAPIPPPRLVNTSIVAELLRRFFNYENRLTLAGHFYPMSGQLFEFHIRHIGRLESFDKDWNHIFTPLNGNKPIPYDYNFGTHPTSAHYPTEKMKVSSKVKKPVVTNGDPNDARKSLLHLLREDSRFQRAICHLLLVDYVCLPMYTLPVECQFLNGTRNAAIAAVSKGQVIPYHLSS